MVNGSLPSNVQPLPPKVIPPTHQPGVALNSPGASCFRCQCKPPFGSLSPLAYVQVKALSSSSHRILFPAQSGSTLSAMPILRDLPLYLLRLPQACLLASRVSTTLAAQQARSGF